MKWQPHLNPLVRPGAAAAAFLLLAASAAHGQTSEPGCTFTPTQRRGGGPYDYLVQRGGGSVERRHFTAKVENLQSGESTSKPGPDIDYTLKKFPNHHRALSAVSRLGAKLQTQHVPGMDYSVNCYFERALMFRPKDVVARMLYAQHLGREKRMTDAQAHLDRVASLAQDNPQTHYNAGLIAFELGDMERALKQAHVAYGLGYTATKLRDDLIKAGRWSDPPSAEAAAAAALDKPAAKAPAPAASDATTPGTPASQPKSAQ
jgi:hypothetical protein